MIWVQKKQNWTFTNLDEPAAERKRSSKNKESGKRFRVDDEPLGELPHFSTLIAAESRRLRGDKGEVPVLNREMKWHISGLLKDFASSGSASDKSLELYVNAEVLGK